VSALHKPFQPTTLEELTMADLTAREQLAATEKQIVELTVKMDALKEQTRAADLATAKELIKVHGFTTTDLKPELKTRGVAATKKTTTKTRPKRK
jgi:hypothetical protein